MALTSNITPLQRIENSFERLAPDQVQPFFNPGTWQLYHLSEWVLKQIGFARLSVTSFSVSEEFLRALVRLKKLYISELWMLVDHRTAAKAGKLSYFANNVCDELLLGKNHSKILFFENEDWNVVAVTSQNLTRGHRFEAGMLSTRPSDYMKLMDGILNESQQFINANELFRKTDTAN